MAKLCNIVTIPTDIVQTIATNSVKTIQNISKNDVTIVQHRLNNEHMTLRSKDL